MTVSLVEATAAARRIQAGGYGEIDFQVCRDAELLAAFVLAGDTERLTFTRAEAEMVADALSSAFWPENPGMAAKVRTALTIVRKALAEGNP